MPWCYDWLQLIRVIIIGSQNQRAERVISLFFSIFNFAYSLCTGNLFYVIFKSKSISHTMQNKADDEFTITFSNFLGQFLHIIYLLCGKFQLIN